MATDLTPASTNRYNFVRQSERQYKRSQRSRRSSANSIEEVNAETVLGQRDLNKLIALQDHQPEQAKVVKPQKIKKLTKNQSVEKSTPMRKLKA